MYTNTIDLPHRNLSHRGDLASSKKFLVRPDYQTNLVLDTFFYNRQSDRVRSSNLTQVHLICLCVNTDEGSPRDKEPQRNLGESLREITILIDDLYHT